MPVLNPPASAAASDRLRRHCDRPTAVTGTLARAGRRRPARRVSQRPLVWWAEVGLVLGLYIAYDTTRGLHRGGVGSADRNGTRIYTWEHDLSLSPEHWLNQFLHHLPLLEVLSAYYYVTLHFIVTPAVLIWMYRSHPAHYRHARTWIAASTCIALVSYWLFPVAPPRLLPGSDIYDTLAAVHQWGWWSAHSAAPKGLGGLVNEYAAMPSLHVGWALWSGWLVVRHARNRVVRGLGVAYPVATSLVVLGTGNHYLFDVLAGALLIAVVGIATALVMRPLRLPERASARGPRIPDRSARPHPKFRSGATRVPTAQRRASPATSTHRT